MTSNKPRTVILYGDSGIGKTSQAYFLARYLAKKYSIIGRLIGSNASDSAPFEDSGMIDKGIVDFFDIANRQYALADMRKLSEGYWPRNAKDKEGNSIIKGYFQKDDNCKTTFEQWQKIGFTIIEGITGVSNLMLNHIRSQEEGVGFKHSFKYEEDGEVIGGLQEGHYGLVQQELYKVVVQGFACLPVKMVIWTALIGKGMDKRIQQTVYGPKGAGVAQTFEIPSWFMDCFHLEDKQVKVRVKNKQGDDEVIEKVIRVAWFQNHKDEETGITYLAKVRILPELYPKLLEKFPHGFVPLDFENGINKLYEEIDRIVGEYQK